MTELKPKIRPIQAVQALRRLMKNKEDTVQVFKLARALDGPVSERNYQTFRQLPIGQTVLSEKRDLARALMDRGHLATLPEGSLGRAYYDFVTREGLSPEGFQKDMEASGEDLTRYGEDRMRYIYRFRHAHDLYHVLTDYGRDELGELSLLAFTSAQSGYRSFRLISFFGGLKARGRYPGIKIGPLIKEGARLGKAAQDFSHTDWEGMLSDPLDQVRLMLNVGRPEHYLAIKQGAEQIDQNYRAQLGMA